MPFFVIFLLIPFIEIAVFIWIGGEIGLGLTLLITFLTAVTGGLIIKYQGFMTLNEMQKNMHSGQLPLKEIFDGFCLVAAGALLITPGFVTDVIGFLLLMPPVRDAMRDMIANSKRFKTYQAHSKPSQAQDFAESEIIEGEFERVDDEKKADEPPRK